MGSGRSGQQAQLGGCTIGELPIVDATIASLVDRLIDLTRTPEPDVAVGINAHLANLCRHDPTLRNRLQGTLNYADGQSVVWAARLLDGRLTERIATTDLAEPLLRSAAARQLPVFFFGAAPGVAQVAAARMAERFNGLNVRSQHGYLANDTQVLTEIAAHQTAILFVGLGDPLQHDWVARHVDRLPPLVLTCGGLFDWLSGSHPRAPRWMSDAGLEWLWRLGLEPFRLGPRYLLGNPAFVYAVLRQRRSQRRIGPVRRLA